MAKVRLDLSDSDNPKNIVICDHCDNEFTISYKNAKLKDIFKNAKHSTIKCPKCGKFQNKVWGEDKPISTLLAAVLIGIAIPSAYFYFTDDGTSYKKVPKLAPSSLQISNVKSAILNEFEAAEAVLYNSGGIYNWVVVVSDRYASQGSWKGYSSAICNVLYAEGVLSKSTLNSVIDHRVRIVERSRYNLSNGNFRSSSLGSTNCKTWERRDI